MSGSRQSGLWISVLTMALSSFAPAIADDATQPSTEPTGSFVAHFTESNPLSDWDKISERMNHRVDKYGGHYKIKDIEFHTYVPPGDPPPEGVGILFFERSDGVPGPQAQFFPLMDKRHLIFIAPSNTNLSINETIGLTLDAIYNLNKQYKINDKRIFFIGDGSVESSTMAMADVVDGAVWIWNIGWIRRIYLSTNKYWDPDVIAPSREMLTLAKTRAYVVGYETDNYQTGPKTAIIGAMQHDGFEHVFKTVISGDMMFPVVRADFVGQMLDLMESAPVAATPHPEAATETAPGSTTQPTGAAPPANPAAAELGLAQTLIANGRSDLAKDKLQEIIQKYPDDPAAAQAQTLLDQINAQQ